MPTWISMLLTLLWQLETLATPNPNHIVPAAIQDQKGQQPWGLIRLMRTQKRAKKLVNPIPGSSPGYTMLSACWSSERKGTAKLGTEK